MATYTKRKGKRGTSYRAQIRIKEKGRIKHTESKTFSTKTLARQWAERRERELESPEATRSAAERSTKLGDLITRYLEETDASFGRTKRMHLNMLTRFDIADTLIGNLTSQLLLDHIRWRRQSVAASTASNDLTWIRVVLEYAELAWGMDVSLEEVDKAKRAARQTRLIGAPKERDRRPTDSELEALRDWFNRAYVGPGRPSAIPMTDIIDFAVVSARRQGEITRLEWRDLNTEDGTCLLRDTKNPRGSKGNHRPFALTQEALDIIERQPRASEFIFPYISKTLSAFFTRACKILNIEDLHFHDLRHEATSRLFEAGYQIHEVQQFTLHDQWSTLQRYTQLRPKNVTRR